MDDQKLMLSICPLPHIKLNFEIRALKNPQTKFEIDPIKIGKLEFLAVMTHKRDNDVIETKC